jgi:hypothetical protein
MLFINQTTKGILIATVIITIAIFLFSGAVFEPLVNKNWAIILSSIGTSLIWYLILKLKY